MTTHQKISVKIFRMKDGVPNYDKVTATHYFYFEASAQKWIDGFNSVHMNDDEEPFIAVLSEGINNENHN